MFLKVKSYSNVKTLTFGSKIKNSRFDRYRNLHFTYSKKLLL